MTKQEVYAFLEEQGIRYEVTEHEAVFHMAEMANVEIPYPEADAKNLFVRDDKKRNYYLITVKGDKRVDLKEFRRAHQLRPLSFASAEDMESILKLTPGSVTPFGVLNDEERRVKVYLDEGFFEGRGLIGVHPNENTATVWLKAEDLIGILRAHGNETEITAL